MIFTISGLEQRWLIVSLVEDEPPGEYHQFSRYGYNGTFTTHLTKQTNIFYFKPKLSDSKKGSDFQDDFFA